MMVRARFPEIALFYDGFAIRWNRGSRGLILLLATEASDAPNTIQIPPHVAMSSHAPHAPAYKEDASHDLPEGS